MRKSTPDSPDDTTCLARLSTSVRRPPCPAAGTYVSLGLVSAEADLQPVCQRSYDLIVGWFAPRPEVHLGPFLFFLWFSGRPAILASSAGSEKRIHKYAHKPHQKAGFYAGGNHDRRRESSASWPPSPSPTSSRPGRPARGLACVANLRTIDGAKATWALEQHKTTRTVPNDGRPVREHLVYPRETRLSRQRHLFAETRWI